jgi:hypothetical protein
VFLCISWQSESSPSKIIFSRLGWLKSCLYSFAHTSRPPESSPVYKVWSGWKSVFMHLRILPDHQNQVLQKLFVSPLEWLKTCFDAYFHTTRLKSLKNYFLTFGVVKTCFDVFPGYQNQVLNKLFFSTLEWLKTCFYAFPDNKNQVLKKFFFQLWSG